MSEVIVTNQMEDKTVLQPPDACRADVDENGNGVRIVKSALAYMEAHYAEAISLASVAEHIYVSQWHLSKLLHKHAGRNFSRILNGIRIEKAKELLRDQTVKIYEIAEQVGFHDVSHFVHTFKAFEQETPSDYRARLENPHTGV